MWPNHHRPPLLELFFSHRNPPHSPPTAADQLGLRLSESANARLLVSLGTLSSRLCQVEDCVRTLLLFSAVLGIQLRAQGLTLTTQAHSPVLCSFEFCFVLSHKVLCFLSGPALDCDPPTSSCQVTGITGVRHHPWPRMSFLHKGDNSPSSALTPSVDTWVVVTTGAVTVAELRPPAIFWGYPSPCPASSHTHFLPPGPT